MNDDSSGRASSSESTEPAQVRSAHPAGAYSHEQVVWLRHELRTPINHIIGYSEMLQEQAEEEGLRDIIPGLAGIRSGGEELLRLINQHLSEGDSRTTADWDRLGKSLNRVIEEVVATASALIAKTAAGRDDFSRDLRHIQAAGNRLLQLAKEGVPSPAAQDQASTAKQAEAGEDPVSPQRKHDGGMLLVAEDNQVSREMLSQRLLREGHLVKAVENGREALEALGKGSFDLVLLDLMMPEMDGFEALRRMKSDPALRHTPVIMLSAVDDLDNVIQCIELGAEDYLPKPFNVVLLRARINASLEKKRLRDQEMLYLRQIETEKARSDKLLNVILPLGLALSAENDFDRLAERLLEGAGMICNADSGTLYLRESDLLRPSVLYPPRSATGSVDGQAGLHQRIPLHDQETGEPNETNLVAATALAGSPISVGDGPDPEAAGSLVASGLGLEGSDEQTPESMLCVPLKDHTAKVIGVLQLVNAKDEEGRTIPFPPYLQQVVESLSSQVAVVLNNQLLRKREAELAKFEHDLLIGQQIQADFLPRKPVSIEGWEVAGSCSPARQVSGDFYDAFLLPGGHLAFVVADVCDKGVPAALFMALIRSLLRALAEHGQESGLPLLVGSRKASSESVRGRLATLVSDLSALNAIVLTSNYIAENHSETNMFATLFFGVLDPETNTLTYVNGGHEAPVILGASGVKERLAPTGPAVGILPDVEFDIGQVHLEPGDSIYVYSDGISDARSEQGKGFGEKRLLEVLSEQPVASATELLQRVERKVREHVGSAIQFDDMTHVAVHSVRRDAE